MSETLRLVKRLVEGKDIQISAHGYDELAADDILVTDVVRGVADGTVVEDYPDYTRAPVCWSCSMIKTAGLSTCYGAFPRMHHLRQWW